MQEQTAKLLRPRRKRDQKKRDTCVSTEMSKICQKLPKLESAMHCGHDLWQQHPINMRNGLIISK